MITEEIRRQVAERANYRCEYCCCPSSYVPDDFAVEHIIPRIKGGSDDITNLAWSCQGCNSRKFTAVSAYDPLTAKKVKLYHPRLSSWIRNFTWSDDNLYLIGKTMIGRATIERLKLNRLRAVNLRRALMAQGEHPPDDG